MTKNNIAKIMSMQHPFKHRLTVIIPTLNEVAYLPGLLDALSAQTRQADEIIIADANSSDGTSEVAQKHGLKVIRGGMPAVGRNAGAHLANGDLLLFLDADVVPPADFISRILTEFDEKGFDVATCFIAALDNKANDKMICSATNLYFRLVQPVSPHAPGFCILSKRTVHEAMGGFDETLTISEDIDYARRANRYGKMGFLTNASIPVSMRRVEKEGILGLGLKYAWCEIYAFAGKPVRSAPFKYEFGTFGTSTDNRQKVISKQVISEQWKRIGDPLQLFGRNIWNQIHR